MRSQAILFIFEVAMPNNIFPWWSLNAFNCDTRERPRYHEIRDIMKLESRFLYFVTK
jgi:hypothetical protein